MHPDDVDDARRCLAHCRKTGEPFATRFRPGPAGAYGHEGRCEALRDQDGAIVQGCGVCLDIDEEIRAQDSLRERERQLSQLVDMVPSLIWCLGPDGEPSYFNKRLVEYVGFNVEGVDTPGMSRLAAVIKSVVHPDDAVALNEKLGRSLTTGEPFSMKYRLRRSDGVHRWIEGRAEPMRDRDGSIIQWYGLCLDIEDEMQTREALRRAQDRLVRATQAASLAEVSASMAHEINQPLAAIVANSSACQRWLSADPPNLDRGRITLERIIGAANSAAEVVSRIRALFRQIAPARTSTDINQVIDEVCRLMADEITMRNVHVETALDRNLPPALLDRIQMQQVLVNLIRNGIDALDTVGGDTRSLRIRSSRDGAGAIRVEVQDHGIGLNEPERIFEPFFTTKKQGMGMGLSICHSIIASHDGRLWATANEPRGATLAFTLPVHAKDAA